jgi:single-stranded-DNA-specific exonuclease
VVIGLDSGTGKGSGRSVEGVDLGASVATLAREGLIERGGGHRMAAGLTLTAGQLTRAMERLAELLARQGAGRAGPRELPIDGVVAPAAATPELLAALEDAGPYGAGSPAPRVAMAGLRIAQARRAGENHLSLALTDAAGGRIAAIAFRAFDGPLGPALEAATGRAAHLAGRLELDDWGGRRRVKLRIEDAALPG